MKHEIEGLPDGWKAIAYRKALWGEWYLGIGWNCKGTELYPSHWMEIPEPPK